MLRRHVTQESGQALLQFALMTVAFFVFIGLAVDAGSLYTERREMQNAADAGALAAAREICLGKEQDEAAATARDFLERNGVDAADIGESDIAFTGNRVVVTAHETAQTYFGNLIGFPTFEVEASASANCGGATSACGLWPIAFDFAMWEGVECGQSLSVWDADYDKQEITCEIGGVPRDICSCYDCDLNNDGTNDFVVMTKLARGWMDFPSSSDPVYTDFCGGSGCGASELACRVENGYGGKVTLPACIPGLKGVKAGVKDEVDSRAGETVQIPLYSSINCASGSNCSGTEAESYYITRFGCVSVTGWVQNFTLYPKPGMPKSYKKITTKTILVTKECGGQCMTFCGTAGEDPAEPWELRAASLSQ